MSLLRPVRLARNLMPGLALGLSAPLLLTQCASMPRAPMAALTGEIGTPEHSLPRHEYPFDENGKYREDWVDASSRRSVN